MSGENLSSAELPEIECTCCGYPWEIEPPYMHIEVGFKVTCPNCFATLVCQEAEMKKHCWWSTIEGPSVPTGSDAEPDK